MQRSDSVYSGLNALSDKCDIVLIHDGARPFVDEDTVIRCIKGVLSYGASCAAVPVKDTIKQAESIGDDNTISRTLDRSSLWIAQTPQGFRTDIIKKAYEKAYEDKYYGTDDAVLAERMGIKPVLVMGSYSNIKITTKEDIALAESIISAAVKTNMA